MLDHNKGNRCDLINVLKFRTVYYILFSSPEPKAQGEVL